MNNTFDMFINFNDNPIITINIEVNEQHLPLGPS
jgi:hypothetical protein